MFVSDLALCQPDKFFAFNSPLLRTYAAVLYCAVLQKLPLSPQRRRKGKEKAQVARARVCLYPPPYAPSRTDKHTDIHPSTYLSIYTHTTYIHKTPSTAILPASLPYPTNPFHFAVSQSVSQPAHRSMHSLHSPMRPFKLASSFASPTPPSAPSLLGTGALTPFLLLLLAVWRAAMFALDVDGGRTLLWHDCKQYFPLPLSPFPSLLSLARNPDVGRGRRGGEGESRRSWLTGWCRCRSDVCGCVGGGRVGEEGEGNSFVSGERERREKGG